MNKTLTYSPLCHLLAWLLGISTVVLISFGALVTTYEAGMAVYDWPTSFGYGMFSLPIAKWIYGQWNVFLEHGHRLLGTWVGMVSIAFCLSCWFFQRSLVFRLSLAALVAVIFQGLLGGMRVLLDEQTLAMLHGSVAHLFLALVTTLVVFTSKSWGTAQPSTHRLARPVRYFSLLIVLATLLQVYFGALLRHGPGWNLAWSGEVVQVPATVIVTLHLTMAAVLTGGIVMLAWLAWKPFRSNPPLKRNLTWMLGILTFQVLAGFAAWIGEFGWNGYTVEKFQMFHVLSTSSHVVLGALLVTTATALSVKTFHFFQPTPRRETVVGPASTSSQLETVS